MDKGIGLTLLLLSLLSSLPAYADIQAGLNWLLDQTQIDGRFASEHDLATSVQATSETLQTLQHLDHHNHPTVEPARDFLTANTVHHTEYVSRNILALTDAGLDVTASVQQLLTYQHPSGGFGDAAGYGPSVLDTAWALQALATNSTVHAVAAGQAVSFLVSQQYTDGSWADTSDRASVYLTALTMRALWSYRHQFALNQVLNAAQSFLLNQRQTNQGWSETFETALALIAILPRLTEPSLVADSLLASSKRRNGLMAVGTRTSIPPPSPCGPLHLAQADTLNPDLATLTGHVLDGDTGLPLAGVRIDLRGPITASWVTPNDGRFQFQALPRGNYDLSFDLPNYNALTAMTTLSLGSHVDLGVVELLKLLSQPTTSTIHGQVTEALTAQPLAGVTISANGQTAHTADDGRYQISNAVPGELTLSASRDGYLTASATATLPAGATLIYSPALTPGTVPIAAALRGQVTDAVSGQPLAGVTIAVTGATTATAITDAQGEYRLEPLAVGPLTVDVNHAGYDPVQARTNVADQDQITFSPTLYPTATSPPAANTSDLSGIVMDASDNRPLAGVTVEATHGDQTNTLTTGADGHFTVGGIAAADVQLRLTRKGYVSSVLSRPVPPLSAVDIGQIRLRPTSLETLLPDLTVSAIDVQDTATHPQDLELSGSIRITLLNRGTRETPAGFEVMAFYDQQGDDRFDPGEDPVLGQAQVSEALAVGLPTNLVMDVAGPLPFRDAPIRVWVDSTQRVIERDETNNVTGSAAFCRLAPVPPGAFSPVIEWAWTSSPVVSVSDQVMAAPVVIDVTDDAVPDVIFATFIRSHHGRNGRLRAISGRDGQEIFTVTSSLYDVYPTGSLAAGDIDHDGRPEIIAVAERGNELIAFEHDGTFKWRSPRLRPIGWGGAALADIDRDGTPEIVVGATVLNADGSVRWQGNHGRGVNGLSPLSLVANLDQTGDAEIVAGNTAYRADGSLYWFNADLTDGFNAVGNFDADTNPEVVLVTQSQLYLLEHDGTVIWGPVALPGGGRGGAPTVADVDADGLPEIGVAGGSAYSVFERDGSIKWSQPTEDQSSNVTGSAVFDFEGDGAVEIVYSDERVLRIYQGITGAVLWETPSPSLTTYELPVIADVDADGQAEIVMVSNNFAIPGPSGIHVYGDSHGTWAPTRQVWNQHTYHITHVSDDGTIPIDETPAWLSHNTYRLNTFADPQRLTRADLTASRLTLVDSGTVQPLSLRLRIGNGGLVAASDVTVAFYQGDPNWGGQLLGTVPIDHLPGAGFAEVERTGVSLAGTEDLYAVIDPDDTTPECNPDNNTVSIPVQADPLGQLTVASEAGSYEGASPVRFTATVTNTGRLETDYIVNLHVEDATGAEVIAFQSRPVVPLAGGAAAVLTQAWNTGLLLVGNYRVVGRLLTIDGRELSRSTSAFTIHVGANAQAALRLTTDQVDYHTMATVTAKALVRNLTSNARLAQTEVVVQLVDASGTDVSTTTLNVGDVAASTQRQVATPIELQGVPQGTYTLIAELRDARGEALATDQFSFEVIENLRLSVQGRVVAAQPEIETGDIQQCTDTVSNLGSLPLSAQPVRQLVVRLDDETLVASTALSVDLAAGASQTLIRDLDTAGLSPGDHACVLQAQIMGEWQRLDSTIFRVAEVPFELVGELTLGDRGRVLVLLDDSYHPRCQGGDRAASSCGDPHGPAIASSLIDQRQFVETVFDEAGWDVTVVTDAPSFVRAFRSGGYTTYLLLSEHIKLSKQIQHELREAVFRGEGLMMAGAHDQRNHYLDDPLGVRFKGKQARVVGITMASSELHPAAEEGLLLGEPVESIELVDATAVGFFELESRPHDDDKHHRHHRRRHHRHGHHSRHGGYHHKPCHGGHGHHPYGHHRGYGHHHGHKHCSGAQREAVAVTINPYGAGRAVYVGFDLLAEATLVSSLPVKRRPVCRAWTDKKLAQIVSVDR